MSVYVISFSSLDFTILSGDECKTTGGKQPNNNCVFPFWFKGTVYETCITVEDDTPWCSTEVDSNGHHVDGQWGYCGEGCPGTTECMLTFN